ncbi:uncharacterized protein MYCGRDRAFT_107795 [Zymoseptoria tritici IPO323]|uniref:Uncharacterized protein n=1 Tax=Zymoseptoria tritici (strain CBS 115943 / IPO323) TaxID=336722 RepID=F9X1Q4_ZYMTI|nr:uncharacterized protein MYCGRDRAFT_107795 [Zymoseptoria tritici IPO323]EGP91821.1 hypothetical protein MYCGRDRAFT_107795 [Zymoseptoria tritici IPO323]
MADSQKSSQTLHSQHTQQQPTKRPLREQQQQQMMQSQQPTRSGRAVEIPDDSTEANIDDALIGADSDDEDAIDDSMPGAQTPGAFKTKLTKLPPPRGRTSRRNQSMPADPSKSSQTIRPFPSSSNIVKNIHAGTCARPDRLLSLAFAIPHDFVRDPETGETEPQVLQKRYDEAWFAGITDQKDLVKRVNSQPIAWLDVLDNAAIMDDHENETLRVEMDEMEKDNAELKETLSKARSDLISDRSTSIAEEAQNTINSLMEQTEVAANKIEKILADKKELKKINNNLQVSLDTAQQSLSKARAQSQTLYNTQQAMTGMTLQFAYLADLVNDLDDGTKLIKFFETNPGFGMSHEEYLETNTAALRDELSLPKFRDNVHKDDTPITPVAARNNRLSAILAKDDSDDEVAPSPSKVRRVQLNDTPHGLGVRDRDRHPSAGHTPSRRLGRTELPPLHRNDGATVASSHRQTDAPLRRREVSLVQPSEPSSRSDYNNRYSMKLPIPFSGENKKDDIGYAEWRQKMDFCLDNDESLDEHQKIVACINNTTGPAFARVGSALVMQTFRTYIDVLGQLDDSYGEHHMAEKYRKAFTALAMKDKEKFDDFWTSFMTYAPYTEYSDVELIRQLKEKLNKRYRADIRGMRFANLNAMKTHLRDVELDWEDEEPSKGGNGGNGSTDKKLSDSLARINKTLKEDYDWKKLNRQFKPVTAQEFKDKTNCFACKGAAHNRFSTACPLEKHRLDRTKDRKPNVSSVEVAAELPANNSGKE